MITDCETSNNWRSFGDGIGERRLANFGHVHYSSPVCGSTVAITSDGKRHFIKIQASAVATAAAAAAVAAAAVAAAKKQVMLKFSDQNFTLHQRRVYHQRHWSEWISFDCYTIESLKRRRSISIRAFRVANVIFWTLQRSQQIRSTSFQERFIV